MSARAFQAVAAAAVWALVLTIVSGAAVRLTGSGLGCPDWPACTRTSLVAPMQFHAWVEFANRLVNAFVTLASLGALAAALLRSPRRRDLTALSAGLVAGLAAEVVLGGLTVEHGLAPGFVMAHFLLAVVFLADAVVLHQRSSIPDPALASPRVALAGRWVTTLSGATLASLAAAVVLGTVVTSTGPHGGDPRAARFDLSLHSVAQLHGAAVEVLLALVLLQAWLISRSAVPAQVVKGNRLLVAACVAQASVGYAQYLAGDPVALVAVHVAGASVAVVAALRFHLALWARPLPAAPEEAPAPALPAAVPAPR